MASPISSKTYTPPPIYNFLESSLYEPNLFHLFREYCPDMKEEHMAPFYLPETGKQKKCGILLMSAVKRKEVQAIEKILSDQRLSISSFHWKKAVFDATFKGLTEVVKSLIHSEPRDPFYLGQMLPMAAERGFFDLVELLIPYADEKTLHEAQKASSENKISDLLLHHIAVKEYERRIQENELSRRDLEIWGPPIGYSLQCDAKRLGDG
jgi:hypothetical protein